MNLKRVYAVFLRQLYILKEKKARAWDVFYWPLLELTLWGVFTTYLQETGGVRLTFVTAIIGTLILWNLLTRIQFGVTISFMEDVWTRSFIHLFSSPLSLPEYIGGLIFTSVAKALSAIIFLILAAWFFLAYNIFSFGMLLVPFAFVLFLFGIALGLAATAVVLRFGRTWEFIIWSLPALVSPLSGVFYPLDALPWAIRFISYALPSAYIFEGMRSVLSGHYFDGGRFLMAFLLVIFYCLVSYWLLHLSYRATLKQGIFRKAITE